MEEKQAAHPGDELQQPLPAVPLGKAFFLLFTAGILSAVGGFMFVLIRSLSMNAMGFDALEISSHAVVGGIISLPLPVLLGWLSDRVDRKWVLILGYLQVVIGLIMLAVSQQLWQFWLGSALAGITVGANNSAGNALVTDLVPSTSLGKALSLFSATAWIGGIIGFALAGLLLNTFGVALSCYIGAILVLAGVGLLLLIKRKYGMVRRPLGKSTP